MLQKTTISTRCMLVFALVFLTWVANAQICVPPLISIQPANKSICVGEVSTFAVVAVGLNLSYQWQVDEGSGYHNCSNGSTYSGSLTATLSVSASVNLNANRYRCVVSNPCGSIISNVCLLTVPSISVSASSTSICAGTSVTLTASGG